MVSEGAVGTGIIILAVLWSIALFLAVTLSRVGGALSYAGIGALVAVIIVTVILWFIPRGPDPNYKDYVIYDTMYIGRTALISFCGVMLLVSLGMLAMDHLFEPQLATSMLTKAAGRYVD
ncbi:hypothetical protein LSAT2_027190 [Lamellibrachia satsuma]|nr:hypothetical protein LSAT2_027190 [Lamellibrachia satsuma]